MKKSFLAIISVFALAAACSAEITFDSFQQTYSPGSVSLGFTITNDLDEAAILSVSAYAYPEGLPSYLDAPPQYWDVELQAGQSEHFSVDFTISDIAEAGTHILSVEVSGNYTDFAEGEFTVVGTLTPLSINVVACTPPCDTYTSAFLLSESPITIEVLNSEGSMLEGRVTTPSGTSEDLSFFQDAAILTLSEAGDYFVEVTASKDGYKEDTQTLEIAVLEKLPEVIKDMPCDADGVCNGEETRQNCPQDCLPGEQGELVGAPEEAEAGAGVDEPTPGTGPDSGGDATILIVAAVLIILLALMLYQRRRS